MWEQLDFKSADFYTVCQPLLDKANHFNGTWSIAEMRLSRDDVHWLRTWFGLLLGNCISGSLKSIVLAHAGHESLLNSEVLFGAILLCLGSEVCREESTEESVWPAIRGLFPRCSPIRDELFTPDGQPSERAKEIIRETVRALNLRHAMDIEGTQQWFITVKLQFGFTFRGAKNRLAEWLVGLGAPHAVLYLNGDSEFSELESQTFQTIWRVLKQYRQGLIGEVEVRQTLHSSPWLRDEWINDLLSEAKARIETLGTGEWSGKNSGSWEEEAPVEDLCPIQGVMLDWPNGSTPRLKLCLDRQAILNELGDTSATELDFIVDGRKMARWLRQGDGSWDGEDWIAAEPEKQKSQPNLSPRMLNICPSSGENPKDWDMRDSGLMDEVLVFDLDRRRRVSAGTERLDRARRYAIICDRACNIQGCMPEETFEKGGIPRKAMRLPTPLDENICIAYEDFALWQPIQPECVKKPRFQITLATPASKILSFGEQTPIHVEGLPQDATDVRLLIHRTTHTVSWDGQNWKSDKPVTITPELAARQRRVRVKFTSDGTTQTVEPRLAFRILGAAMLRHPRKGDDVTIAFEPLKKGMEINLSEGTKDLRLWTPKQDRCVTAFEADCQVARTRHSKIHLRDIPGHGGDLRLMVDGEIHSLGVSCRDTGCIRGFAPAVHNSPAQLFLLQEKDPKEIGNSGYSVCEWALQDGGKARFRVLPHDNVLPNSSHRAWKLNCLACPMAISITWKGDWRGAWWSVEHIRDYFRNRKDLPEHDFAILKWLRVPVLHPTLEPEFRRMVIQAPCRFLKTWTGDIGLPDGILPHGNINGCDSVVRHFLWNDFPVARCKEGSTVAGHCDGGRFDKKHCCDHLQNLAAVSPVLFWEGLRQCEKRCHAKVHNLLELLVCGELGLLPDAKKQQSRYRLQGKKRRLLDATGLSGERLDEIVTARMDSLENPRNVLSQEDRAELLKVGQTISGRDFIRVRIALHWLESKRV